MAIDLSQLPAPDLKEETYDQRLKRLKTDYQEGTKTTENPDGVYPLPSYPETFVLEITAQEGELTEERINEEVRQNLLAFATGSRLDHLGAFVAAARLPAAHAVTTFRFQFSGHPAPQTIPSGYQIQVGGGRVAFETTEAAVIQVGETTIDVPGRCVEAGEAGNGFVAGEINDPVSPLPYLVSVENTTVTRGGAEEEGDDRFRLRIQLAPEELSNAGTAPAYISHAKKVHQSIVDADAWGSDAVGDECKVWIVGLWEGGEPLPADIQSEFEAYLSRKDVRALGDKLIFMDAEAVNYTVTATLQIYKAQEALAAAAKDEAESRLAALTEAWANKLRRDIVPEDIIDALQSISGVYRVVLTEPSLQELERWQFPKCTGYTVGTEIVDKEAG